MQKKKKKSLNFTKFKNVQSTWFLTVLILRQSTVCVYYFFFCADTKQTMIKKKYHVKGFKQTYYRVHLHTNTCCSTF